MGNNPRSAGGQPRGADVAVHRLAERIQSARYALHSRLPPERELAEQLQVSRARLRHALRLLESEGQIWRHVGLGTFVGSRPMSVGCDAEALGAATTLTEIFEARCLVEPMVARLAAQRAQQSDVKVMERYSASANKARGWAEWERWDELLHRSFAEASGNGLLISAVDQILRIKKHPRWTLRRAEQFDATLTVRYGHDHFAIIAAITGRDGDGAEAAMRRHMFGVTTTVGPTITNRNRPRSGTHADQDA